MIVLDSKQMRDIACALGLVLFLGALLLFFGKPVSEGFSNTFFCDVDNPCPGHLKCINGQCAKTDPRPIQNKDAVPLLPPGSPAPYF